MSCIRKIFGEAEKKPTSKTSFEAEKESVVVTETEHLIWNFASGIRASVSCGPSNEFTNKQLEAAIRELAAALDAKKN